MRVLIISDAWHPQVNGVVRTYEYLIEELTALGHTTDVIGPADFAFNIPMPFYSEIKLAIAPYKKLCQLIADFQPNKIHIATEGPLGWAAIRYCKEHKLPYTSSYHTQFPDYVAKRFAWLIPSMYEKIHALGIRYVNKFHRNSKAVMVATKSLQEQLTEWSFKMPLHMVSRGINLDIFAPGEKTLFLDLKQPIALYVGRISIEKNLEAFLDMPWEGSKILVGDGPARKSLQKRYPKAHFVGKKTGKDLADHYRSSDVFVFPSKTDTFGIVLIEALACGLPVAAYNVMGPKDIITHEKLGALEEHDLAAACHKAMANGDKSYCARHAKKNYSWKNAGEQFIEML